MPLLRCSHHPLWAVSKPGVHRSPAPPSGVIYFEKYEVNHRMLGCATLFWATCRTIPEEVEPAMGHASDRLREIRASVTRETLLCLAAVLLMSFEGQVLNSSLYAHVATYFGIAREINTFVGAAFAFVLFVVAMRKPSLLDKRLILIATLGCLLTSTVVLEMAMPLGNGAFTVVGLAFSRIGSLSAMAFVAIALCKLPSMLSITVAAAGGLSLGAVVQALMPLLPVEAGIIVAALCSAISIALLYRPARGALDRIASREAPIDLELANPESFFAPTHGLFLCTLLFSVASGYALTLNEVEHAPAFVDIIAVVLVGVALWMILSRVSDKEDKLFSFSCLLVIAGFLVAPLTFFSETASANALIRIGIVSFDILLWLVIAAVGRRNALALLPTFALLRCMKAIGTNMGAIVGHTSNDLIGVDSQPAAIMASIVLFAFVAFLWIGFRKFSFVDAIKGIVEVGVRTVEDGRPSSLASRSVSDEKAAEKGKALSGGGDRAAAGDGGVADGVMAAGGGTAIADGATAGDEAADAPPSITRGDGCAGDLFVGERDGTDSGIPDTIEARCSRLGAECGLTERETEIFAMLARGRNGRFVMEHYVVSRNTVKSHVKHIYAKLDVHSQQELIDLVEHAE